MLLYFLAFFVFISVIASVLLTALCTMIIYTYILRKTRFIKDKAALEYAKKALPKIFVETMLLSCAAGIIFGLLFSLVSPLLAMPASYQFSGPYFFFFAIGAYGGISHGWQMVKNEINTVLMVMEVKGQDAGEAKSEPSHQSRLFRFFVAVLTRLIAVLTGIVSIILLIWLAFSVDQAKHDASMQKAQDAGITPSK